MAITLDKQKFNWRVYFQLSEKVECREYKEIKSVKLHIAQDNKTLYIIGFTLSFVDVLEDEIEDVAERKAKALTDQISILTRHYVQANMKGCNQVLDDGQERVTSMLTSKFNIRNAINLDLQSPDIRAAINNYNSSGERYHYVALGLKAEAFEIYDMMILSFYKSIKYISDLKDPVEHYKPLRDVLSHVDKLYKTTFDLLNEKFPNHFEFTKGGAFDRNSKKNNDNLKIEAMKLKTIVMDHFCNGK